MVDSLTPDGLAEAIERARFSLLRQGTWDDLREGERKTRVEILRNAMDTAGVTMRLQALELRAQQSAELSDLIDRREVDFKRRLAADDAEIVRLSDTIAELTEKLASVTAERDTAQARAAQSDEKLVSIRDVLDGVRLAPVPVEVPTQSTAPAAKATRGAAEKLVAAARRTPRRAPKSTVSVATGS